MLTKEYLNEIASPPILYYLICQGFAAPFCLCWFWSLQEDKKKRFVGDKVEVILFIGHAGDLSVLTQTKVGLSHLNNLNRSVFSSL